MGGKPDGKHRSGSKDYRARRAVRIRQQREAAITDALHDMLSLLLVEHTRKLLRAKLQQR